MYEGREVDFILSFSNDDVSTFSVKYGCLGNFIYRSFFLMQEKRLLYAILYIFFFQKIVMDETLNPPSYLEGDLRG